MNDVIIIYELCHNDVGVAADYKSAIFYMLNKGWINCYTDITDDNDNLVPIIEALGEYWRIVLLNANKDWFNDKFANQFRLEDTQIYKHG